MNKTLQYIAIIFVVALAIVVLAKLRSCKPEPQDLTGGTITVPADKNFMPVEHRTEQPSSWPWAKDKTPMKLPEGVKEKDVKQIISVKLEPTDSSSKGKTIDIILMNAGEIFVRNDSAIKSVTQTVIVPPLLDLRMTLGIGLSLSRQNESFRVMPTGTFSPARWAGWLRAPQLVVDLDGIGAGASVKLYHDIDVGAAKIFNYGEGSQLKLTLTYNF